MRFEEAPMVGRSTVAVTAESQAQLQSLAGSHERGEADRARAISLAVAEDVLSVPVANRTNWTLRRLAAQIEQRAGLRISASRLSVVLRKKGISVGAAPGTR